MTVTHPMYVPYEGLLTASGQVIALSSGARIDGTLTGSAEAFCISAEYADLERLTTSDKNGHFVFQALPTGRWGDPRTMLRKADQARDSHRRSRTWCFTAFTSRSDSLPEPRCEGADPNGRHVMTRAPVKLAQGPLTGRRPGLASRRPDA